MTTLQIKGNLVLRVLGIGPHGVSLLMRLTTTEGKPLMEQGPWTLDQGEELCFEGMEVIIRPKVASGGPLEV